MQGVGFVKYLSGLCRFNVGISYPDCLRNGSEFTIREIKEGRDEVLKRTVEILTHGNQ